MTPSIGQLLSLGKTGSSVVGFLQLGLSGGWSRRATLYGSDATPGRDAKLLDPAVDPARVRARHRVPPGWSEWHAIDSRPAEKYYDYT